MEMLKSKAEKLGTPKIEGTDTVAGKQVPALYFGSIKQNNNFALVDDVVNEAGGTATIFVKSGDEFVRVATNLKKDDGSRAIGTVLDPKGKAMEALKKNEAFYGDADILGKTYATGYEPIRDAAKTVGHSDGVRLIYRQRRDTDNWQDVNEFVPFVVTDTPFGGQRQWFRCLSCGCRCPSCTAAPVSVAGAVTN